MVTYHQLLHHRDVYRHLLNQMATCPGNRVRVARMHRVLVVVNSLLGRGFRPRDVRCLTDTIVKCICVFFFSNLELYFLPQVNVSHRDFGRKFLQPVFGRDISLRDVRKAVADYKM